MSKSYYYNSNDKMDTVIVDGKEYDLYIVDTKPMGDLHDNKYCLVDESKFIVTDLNIKAYVCQGIETMPIEIQVPEPNTFYIYTTAILYREDYDERRGMIDNWRHFLASTINIIKNKYNNVVIIHYHPDEFTEADKGLLEMTDTSISATYRISLQRRELHHNSFPRNLDLSTTPHIIIDMAHFVQIASQEGAGFPYTDYNIELLRNYKYVYFDYDNNIKKLTSEDTVIDNLPLFRINEDNSITTANDILVRCNKDVYDYIREINGILHLQKLWSDDC